MNSEEEESYKFESSVESVAVLLSINTNEAKNMFGKGKLEEAITSKSLKYFKENLSKEYILKSAKRN